MDISFRWLDEQEHSLGQKVLNDIWAKNHILSRDSELFLWSYFRSPGPSGFLVGCDGAVPVACVGRIGFKGHLRSSIFNAAAMTCIKVLPEHKKSGLGLSLIKRAYTDMHLVTNIGSNPNVCRLYKALGQEIVPAMPRYVAVADMEAVEAVQRISINPDAVTLSAYSACSRLRACPSPHGYAAEPCNADNLLEWDTAWKRFFAPNLIGCVRDACYLRWRYLEHPRFNYEVFFLRKNKSNLCGMAVTRRIAFTDELLAIRILDFLAVDEVAGKALSAAVFDRVPPNAAFVEHTCLGRQWRPLQEIGLGPEGSDSFSVYFSPPDLRYRAIMAAFKFSHECGMSTAEFLAAPQLYMTIADSDQDRPN